MRTERKKTVLIIDDSEFMRGLIKSILNRNGFRVVGEAENGKIGVEKYKQLRPDIVTSDVIMDETCGLTALEQIMEHDPDAKVIIISSMMGQKWFIDEAELKGAKAIITKPIDAFALIEAFRTCIQ